MEETVRIEAKTVEAAIEEACEKLSCSAEEIEYEIVEKGASGFLGFKSKPYVIEAKKRSAVTVNTDAVKKEEAVSSDNTVKTDISSENAEELCETAKDFLKGVFSKMDIDVEITASYNNEEGCLEVNMAGDDMGNIIGKRGQTLDSLQYLTSLVVNKKTENYTRVKLDTENYRERRKETLENLATNIAFKVKRTKRSVKLEPMNPYERRIIHSALQNDRYVTTKSEGEEPYRHVVVSLKKDKRY